MKEARLAPKQTLQCATIRNLLVLAAGLFLSAVVAAENQNASRLPTWQDEIAKGFVPYRQLTVDDFPINDRAHPDAGFWVKGFIDPHYYFYLKPAHGGFVYAYVSEWIVFSGFDKNESSRKSSFHDMKAELPYAQAVIDIHELKARELAALKTGDLPSGRGESFGAAQADLKGKMKVFCEEKYEQVQAECDGFAKATGKGQDKKKVRELAAEIRKRLDAIPVVNAPGNTRPAPATASTPSTSPTVPTASATVSQKPK
jgi:hypothetical protein